MTRPRGAADADELMEVLGLLRELSERPRRTKAGTLTIALLSALWGLCVGLLLGGCP